MNDELDRARLSALAQEVRNAKRLATSARADLAETARVNARAEREFSEATTYLTQARLNLSNYVEDLR
ncbi:MAG: hypothetical protein ACREHG_03995 [Candidatus Saccharimonadales bacterium]